MHKNHIVAGLLLALNLSASNAPAQQNSAPNLTAKMQPYIACINRESGRARDSAARYEDWAGKAPQMSNKIRNVLGLYTIYEPDDCLKGIEKANSAEPHDKELETAGSNFAAALQVLYPLLNEANDYYDQGNYKDDKMAKGKLMHPKLLAAYDNFEKADDQLHDLVSKIADARQMEDLAAIEKTEGKNDHYFLEATMINAKAVLKAEKVEDLAKMDVAQVSAKIDALEGTLKDLQAYADAHKDAKVDTFVTGAAKQFLTAAKEFMRRVRDKTPYNQGDKMMLGMPGSGWMVSGSLPQVLHNYNQLVDRYNMSHH